jgi:hypothetical protein
MGANGNGKLNFAARRKTVTVEVPELGATFHLRALSVGQVRQLRRSENDPNDAMLQVAMLALAIIDDAGNGIYTTSEDDLANINEMPFTAFDKLISALNELHGSTAPQQDELLKN